MPAAFLRMIIEERCPSVRWSVVPSVREKRGVARIFVGGGSALRVLNQLFDIWLFFNSLFLSPCNVFFCFAFSEIFSPCFGSGGDRWPHITFIYATLIFSFGWEGA